MHVFHKKFKWKFNHSHWTCTDYLNPQLWECYNFCVTFESPAGLLAFLDYGFPSYFYCLKLVCMSSALAVRIFFLTWTCKLDRSLQLISICDIIDVVDIIDVIDVIDNWVVSER